MNEVNRWTLVGLVAALLSLYILYIFMTYLLKFPDDLVLVVMIPTTISVVLTILFSRKYLRERLDRLRSRNSIDDH